MSWSLRRKFSALLVGIGCTVGAVQAGPYSDMFIFGDSLSDTGNVLALASGTFPAFPGAEGRFSNGPVWTEHLAAGLGLPAASDPTRLLYVGGNTIVPIGPPGGNNYAYGGARTLLDGSAFPTSGLLGQLVVWSGSDAFLLAPGTPLARAADPNALYVVVAGANDLRDARTANPGATAADAAARTAAAASVATNLSNVVGLLAQAGARHFLISSLPDLGKTPEAAGLGVQAASTDITLKFNTALDAAMGQLDSIFNNSLGIDLDIRELDFYGLVEAVFADPAAFGVTNTIAPCINPIAPGAYYHPLSTDINCSVSLFSDPLHPSARAHQLVGEAALRAVPLPNSIALVLLASMMLVVVRRRAA